jgi:hypothetical protein
MEGAGLSSLASQRTRWDEMDAESHKFTPNESLELDTNPLELPRLSGQTEANKPWYARRLRRLSAQYPRAARAVFWLQGPRPKVDLPRKL